MSHRVDVLLPTRGRSHTIGHAIGSVRAQSTRSWKLHVVNDGGDAATEALVRSIGDPRIEHHAFPKGRGFGYEHRNTLLRKTSAPVVAYMTDDDLWFPDHLERGVAALESGPVDLVAFRSIHATPPGDLDLRFFAYDWRLGRLSDLLRSWFIGSANLVHTRSLFDEVGYWDQSLSRFGDREFFARVRRSGRRFRYEDVVTVLRFYARHWDGRYPPGEAPQKAFLERLLDPAWVERVRRETRAGPRPLSVRSRQCADFLRFALGSGPKLLRFWLERTRRGP